MGATEEADPGGAKCCCFHWSQSAELPICFSRQEETPGCVFMNTTKKASDIPKERYIIKINGSECSAFKGKLTRWTITMLRLADTNTSASTQGTPPNLKICEPDTRNHTSQPEWTLCRGKKGTSRPISSDFGSLIDWSPHRNNLTGCSVSTHIHQQLKGCGR